MPDKNNPQAAPELRFRQHQNCCLGNSVLVLCASSGKSYVTARSFSARSCSRVFGFSIVIDFLFDFGDKKRPPTFRIVRPVNGLIFGIRFFKLAGGEQHFILFADGKFTRDSRFSVARECSHLDGTK